MPYYNRNRPRPTEPTTSSTKDIMICNRFVGCTYLIPFVAVGAFLLSVAGVILIVIYTCKKYFLRRKGKSFFEKCPLCAETMIKDSDTADDHRYPFPPYL